MSIWSGAQILSVYAIHSRCLRVLHVPILIEHRDQSRAELVQVEAARLRSCSVPKMEMESAHVEIPTLNNVFPYVMRLMYRFEDLARSLPSTRRLGKSDKGQGKREPVMIKIIRKGKHESERFSTGVFQSLISFILKRLTELPIIVLLICQFLINEWNRVDSPILQHDRVEFAVFFRAHWRVSAGCDHRRPEQAPLGYEEPKYTRTSPFPTLVS